jgi:GTPase involved in cell partitioning and DNA repair
MKISKNSNLQWFKAAQGLDPQKMQLQSQMAQQLYQNYPQGTRLNDQVAQQIFLQWTQAGLDDLDAPITRLPTGEFVVE